MRAVGDKEGVGEGGESDGDGNKEGDGEEEGEGLHSSSSSDHLPPHHMPPLLLRLVSCRRGHHPGSFLLHLFRSRLRLRRGSAALSDIRQSYLISVYRMRAVFIAFIACDIAFIPFVA